MRVLLYQLLFALIAYLCYETKAYSLLLFAFIFVLLSESLDPIPRDGLLRKWAKKRYLNTFGYSIEDKDKLIKKFLISKIKSPKVYFETEEEFLPKVNFSNKVLIEATKLLTHDELLTILKKTPYSYDKVFYWCFMHYEPYFLKTYFYQNKGCEIYYELRDYQWDRFISLMYSHPQIQPLLESTEFAMFLKTGKIKNKDKHF